MGIMAIDKWWVGKVLEINYQERYFIAHLRDMKFIESIAEFDFDNVFNDKEDVNKYLFEGSEFTFYILIRHGRGGPEPISRIEFSSPYFWKDGDNKRADELYKTLFVNE